MSHQTVTAKAVHQTTSPRVSHETTRLLSCGVVAGPLFLVVWALQAFTRDGFDPSRHPISLLSLGDHGWIQIANFVMTGTLFVACAAGMRRALHHGGQSNTWGPRLIDAMGAGLIVAGVFLTDAGAGFPAGAPTGKPEMSWHGALHEVGYVVVMLSWTAACFVLRRRFAALKERGLARLSVAAVVAGFVVSGWPHPDSFTVRIVVATAIQFGFVSVVAARMRHLGGQ